jgi:glycosyltransferase involved in cell wall biosynthesis
MKTLVLTSRPVKLLRHGYDIRVANLCARMPGERHLAVVPIGPEDRRPPTIDHGFAFHTDEQLEPLYGARKSWRRFARVSEDHFLERSYPQAFARVLRRIEDIVRERGITHVVVFGSNLAELGHRLKHPRTMIDVCDSVALTLRRAMDGGARAGSAAQRWHAHWDLHRWRATEGALPSRFSLVTTINDADSREIVNLSGGKGRNVHTVPNGVAESYLSPMPEPGHRRGVAFWGNLFFPPNAHALRHFMLDIYLPHLQQHGVEVFIAGDGAPDWLRDLAARDRNVKLAGFVDDLRSAVAPYPLMVNPMTIGSGLKNKVLEAFGLGMCVVSTSLGMEAFPQARPGVHHRLGDDPAAFAGAVLSLLDDEPARVAMREAANRLLHEHYPWDVVGRRWNELVARC